MIARQYAQFIVVFEIVQTNGARFRLGAFLILLDGQLIKRTTGQTTTRQSPSILDVFDKHRHHQHNEAYADDGHEWNEILDQIQMVAHGHHDDVPAP
jgi:hypothetical protein